MFFVLISLLFELSTGMAAWHFATPPMALPFLLAHGLGCLLFSIGAVKYLSQKLDDVTDRDHIFFLSLGFFIPILGMLGLCWVLFSFQKLKPKGTDAELHMGVRTADNLMLRNAPQLSQLRSVDVNTGMLISIMQYAPQPRTRISALLETLRLPDQDALNILRVALRDDEDDVRLLAYALLSQMDKRYNNIIQSRLAMLSQVSANERYSLHKRIAQEYFELAWVGLARGEGLTPILRKAREHISSAVEGYPEDPGLYFLLGKILLRLKCFDEAATVFLQAKSYGMEAGIVAPYLAEIAFSWRHLSLVGELMARSRLDVHRGISGELKSYWDARAYEG